MPRKRCKKAQEKGRFFLEFQQLLCYIIQIINILKNNILNEDKIYESD